MINLLLTHEIRECLAIFGMIYLFMLLFSPHTLEYPEPASDFERQVLDFCQKWQAGQTHFEFSTSGSTGTPKSILIAREAMIASAELTGNWLNLVPNDVALLSLPVQYIAGAMVLVRAIVLKLQLVVLEPSVNPLKDLPPISIHLASFVPNQWHGIIQDKIDLPAYFYNSKGVLLGGAGISPWLLSQTKSLKFPVFLTYGMTETVSHVAYQAISPAPSTYFKLLPTVEFEIAEDACARFKAGMTANQWVKTNDLVERVDSNHFKLLGRLDRVINSAGRKIHAEKIEDELSKLFSDRKYFISGLPDDALGQKAVLFMEGSEPIDLSILRQESLEHLQSWEIPKEVIYLAYIETTDSGKMDRLKSVDLYLKTQK
jgi:o-succinylbenzoate---CoA ligase